jgi:hypothetical protein
LDLIHTDYANFPELDIITTGDWNAKAAFLGKTSLNKAGRQFEERGYHSRTGKSTRSTAHNLTITWDN